MRVAVVGALGRVGFPFSVALANIDGYEVVGYDYLTGKNFDDILNRTEDGLKEAYKSAKDLTFLNHSDDNTKEPFDVVCIMIGTPVDEEGNGRIDPLLEIAKSGLIRNLKTGGLVVLRSTVSIGTTDAFAQAIFEKWNLMEGIDYHLVFAPERVAQGKSLVEISTLPQLIGAYSIYGYDAAHSFFAPLGVETIHLEPKEAEFGKLITNMYRYINFAMANEFYMIGSDYNINTDKVIDAVNLNYPRMNLPKPGPNVGGPCLFKDGKFLNENIPYVDLIDVAFKINEGMPRFIFNKIGDARRVLVLGLTFKKDSDDTRNSLSFKFLKILKSRGIEYVAYDPYVSGSDTITQEDISRADAIVVMTPHDEFLRIEDELLTSSRNTCIIVDIWKHLKASKNTSGIYKVGDI